MGCNMITTIGVGFVYVANKGTEIEKGDYLLLRVVARNPRKWGVYAYNDV